ncbi:MAG TPA: J domain-containing protein [Rhizomicrobium sp.]|jgi:DnaJ-domain-containing protein 1|nr:J domain-containing protein [Rhizomicrobium sp.]
MIKNGARNAATKQSLVEIMLVDGNSFLGKMHVPLQGRMSDTLNDARAFIPVEMGDGSHVAIAKSAIKKVTLTAAEEKTYRGSEPHRVLGVAEGASPEEVKRAYHKLCSKNHPDRIRSLDLGADFEELATQTMMRINAAYAQLMRGANVKTR